MALSNTHVSATPSAGALAWRTLHAFRRHFLFKSIGIPAFTWVFFVAYFYLLRHPNGPVTTMPMTALDRWIGFQPWALPLYLSLWVYVSLPPALMSSRRKIVGYGARIGVVCLIGLGVFYIWPTKVSPVAIDLARHPAFAILQGIAASGNACPSLHVATAVFAAFWLNWMAPSLGLGTRMRLINVLWCAAIVYSTMATKQHVVVDVICGAALGAAVAWLTRPRAADRFAGTPEPVSSN